ncbi:ATP-binding protein [Streptomyces sp. NPDC004726]
MPPPTILTGQTASEAGRRPCAADVRRIEVSFRPEPACVSLMRRLTADILQQGDPFELKVVYTVQLLVSEILTNAIAYGNGSRITLALECDPLREVRIEVDDRSPGTPEVRWPGPDEESGRGMQLVAHLAREWGREGTSTWCTVSAAADGEEGRADGRDEG